MLVLGMGLWKQSLIWRGHEITLEASPVDPWDPFRGDYVALSYKVGRVPVKAIGDVSTPVRDALRVGDVLYVEIEPKGQYWLAKRVRITNPVGVVFLKGHIQKIEFDQDGKRTYFSVAFGIESWFVQRGEGRKIENVQGGSRPIIAATVSVTPEGVAILRRARVAGVQRPNPESTIVGPLQTP